ncbi:ABC transporter ATP-binding protein [Sulfurospirillum arcachonense]|uniref:ABC transporter ATP-binding protein n=1 Tax=Sulfurospirillum arcachonense TaxID=57666 RepID=UPI0004BAAD82|nr:ABC transporter ATP-binding protein [Sulfurospirillum arcachonense]
MLSVKNVCKEYKKGVRVLDDISFEIASNSCVGLIGESGSGKSTLGRLILGLEKATLGAITMDSEPIHLWHKHNRGEMSVVFQDYNTSVNPRFCVEQILQESLWMSSKKMSNTELKKLLQSVELPVSFLNRYAHELSGGQLQRVCIARALVSNPRFLLLDESLSALDVSVQAEIVKLLKHIQNEKQMSYFFIAHDLESVSALCDTLMVLHQGKIVESVRTESLKYAQHPYTQKLLDAVIPF